MSYWSHDRYDLTQGRFNGPLQYLRTYQSDSRKLNAEEGRSNAVRKGGFSGVIALSLLGGERPWMCASDSMLPKLYHSQFNSLLLQG
jgi:hypothetical protein